MNKSQVLIIDDDKNIAEYFATMLTMMDFEVDIVVTAKEGLARLAAIVPDLILLDMRLGREIGGEDILYQIRSNPRFDNTRVVVITAYPTTVDAVTNLADVILIKPVAVDLFQTLITRLVTTTVSQKHLQFRDPITQLFNKDFFITRLELAFERSRRREEFIYAVLLFDLELTVPAVSPEVTLCVLRETALRLKHLLRPTDTIARVSGLKFIILIEDLKKPEDVEIIKNRLSDLLMEPFDVEGEKYQAVMSLGKVVNRLPYRYPADIYDAAEADFEQARKSRG